MSYVPNFSSPRTIEGHVINCIFKPFVTRLTASLKFLKSSENVVSVSFILNDVFNVEKVSLHLIFVFCFCLFKKGVVLRCSPIIGLHQRCPRWYLPAGVTQWLAGFSRTSATTARHSARKQWLFQVKLHWWGRECFGLGEIQSFLSFARDCLQSTGDDCGGVPPATFFVVDETTSEKNRKGKKNPRYLTFALGVSFPLVKAYRFSV